MTVGLTSVNHDNVILSEIFSAVQVTGSALLLFSSLPVIVYAFAPYGAAVADAILVCCVSARTGADRLEKKKARANAVNRTRPTCFLLRFLSPLGFPFSALEVAQAFL
jgi:hypothetical protein